MRLVCLMTVIKIIHRHCRECGVELDSARRWLCDECLRRRIANRGRR